MVLMKSYENRFSLRLNTRVKRTITLIFILGFLIHGILVISDFQLSPIDSYPKIQYNFQDAESIEERNLREQRRASIKNGFLHAWRGYTKFAWGYDELKPVSEQGNNKFNGWGATIVDSLDTLWIMDLKEEFNESREFVSQIDFTRSDQDTNVFETIIRYLGGLISAFELSRDSIFLEKARELGIALLPAFNSPTGLPYNYLRLNPDEEETYAWGGGLLAEVGTSLLEFTKLTQLTGDREFFTKVDNITEVIFKAPKKIPGLYPVKLSQGLIQCQETLRAEISFGANGDSFYEYLIKEHVLVRGALDKYREMYIESIENMHKYLIKESPVKERPDLLFIGELDNTSDFLGKMGHLSCFVPGMLAIGSKIFDRPKDLEVAIRLAETCYWSYGITKTGIGAEEVWFEILEEENNNADNAGNVDNDDSWILKRDGSRYRNHLPKGIVRLGPSYSLLRPETVESLFILYRITGDKKYQEQAWDIWQSLEKWTKTPAGYSGLLDVDSDYVIKDDCMERIPDSSGFVRLIWLQPFYENHDELINGRGGTTYEQCGGHMGTYKLNNTSFVVRTINTHAVTGFSISNTTIWTSPSLESTDELLNLNLTNFVDLRIGTDNEGHIFPGACLPFGMVKVGLDTDFSEDFHAGGTGGEAKYGVISQLPIVVPLSELNLSVIKSPRSFERFTPGYSIFGLERYNITVELTATRRAALHQYTYPENANNNSHVIIDISHFLKQECPWCVGKFHDGAIYSVNNTQVKGMGRYSGGWNQGGPYKVYFCSQFDTPAIFYSTWWNFVITNTSFDVGADGHSVGAILTFDTNSTRVIRSRVGISFISATQACQNAESEIPNFDFIQIKREANKAWERELEKIVVEGGDDEIRTIFYSSLYRTMIMPSDRTGENPKWESFDKNGKIIPHYDDFYALVKKDGTHLGKSLVIRIKSWIHPHPYKNKFKPRTTNPLYTLFQPKRQ
ncbi:3196_t:CDS:10, partial [Acaulospora morrowiae]